MQSDSFNKSFWRSYHRRIRGMQKPDARSISRKLLSTLKGRRSRAETSTSLMSATISHSRLSGTAIDFAQREAPGDTSYQELTSTVGREDSRYILTGDVLGEGGMGKVAVAVDRVLDREVALKMPHPEVASEPGRQIALLEEPRLTARLEHPNIVPVYDLVVSEEKHCGYAMRRVCGERFSEILRDLRQGAPARVQAYGRVRLLTIFSQVVAAAAYAHDQRVIHRDLKPNNIMIGDYGEVVLLDWGLARPLSGPEQKGPSFRESSWDFEGAPAYISPEQLEGDENQVNERSDIYALGAILYEILTYSPPYTMKPFEDEKAFVNRIRSEPITPPTSAAPGRYIPPALEEICMKCLNRDPSQRYQSALEIHREIAIFLEGTREQEWRRKSAEAKTQEAKQAFERYLERRLDTAKIQKEADTAASLLRPYDSIERKRPVWNLQSLAQQSEDDALQEFSKAEQAFHQALDYLQHFKPAHLGLAHLYWERFVQAESSHNLKDARYFEGRVRMYDVEKEFDVRLKGDGSLTLESEPNGAEVILFSYRTTDRVLKPTDPRPLGRTPIRRTRIPVGNYLIILRHPQYRDVRFPLLVSRLETIEARVRLYREDELGPDYVYVPAGNVRLGGDPDAFVKSSSLKWVGDFAIGRYPITAAQYLEFINELAKVDSEEAYRRAPRREKHPAPIWKAFSDGLYHITPDEDGDPWSPEYPIFLVSWEDAVAFAAWRGARENRPYRLPSGVEWEKAARGVDGRFFPWGNEFDATFCKNRESQPTRALPESIGRYPFDESPYGVRDMAGGVSDWTAERWGNEGNLRLTKGGNWTVPERSCRLARNLFYRQDGTNLAVGFRLAFSLSKRWTRF